MEEEMKEHTPYCLSQAVKSALENARDDGRSFTEQTQVAMEWALGYLADGTQFCRCNGERFGNELNN